jgi:hypothetical protein
MAFIMIGPKATRELDPSFFLSLAFSAWYSVEEFEQKGRQQWLLTRQRYIWFTGTSQRCEPTIPKPVRLY